MIKNIVFAGLLFAFPLVLQPASAAPDCDRYFVLCEVTGLQPSVVRSGAATLNPRRIVIVHGLGGRFLSPMYSLGEHLTRKGYDVTYDSPTAGAAAVIGHSMGCFDVAHSVARKKVFIDCPVWAHGQFGTQRGAFNFFTMAHPKISGAKNIHLNANHITAPQVAQRQILALF